MFMIMRFYRPNKSIVIVILKKIVNASKTYLENISPENWDYT